MPAGHHDHHHHDHSHGHDHEHDHGPAHDHKPHDHHGHDHHAHDHGHGHNHGHGHGHDHGHGHHGHHHGPASFGAAFVLGIILNGGFVVAEAVYGLASNSLSLLADAAHNLGDVLGLVLSGGAIWLSRRLPTRARSYGYGRGTILASLINAVVLMVSVGAIGIEAIQRAIHPEAVAQQTVMWVAAAGILINGSTALMFMAGRRGELNVRGAFLHMLADAGISFGVVVSAFLIGATGMTWIDPATSLAIAAAIGFGTWGLLKDSLDLALDAVPPGVDPQAIERHLRTLPGVTGVHDLHIWGLSTQDTAMTVHLVRTVSSLDDSFLSHLCRDLKERFGIGHATIQVEQGDEAHPCSLEPDHVV